jgi:DNA-binding ferritin-like protein (Dps family)
MTVFISKFITKVIGDKRRWRQYQARTRQLPPSYRTAIEAVERYLMRSAIPESGDSFMAMFEDLADLFEQAGADGTPIREIVGDDPVEFAEAFLRNYSKPGWNTGERDRLSQTIERLEREGEDR